MSKLEARLVVPVNFAAQQKAIAGQGYEFVDAIESI
jgi:hypothetical protein